MWTSLEKFAKVAAKPTPNFIPLFMKPHRGTLILVLGILGLIVCGPLGIAAWIMGSSDLKEMSAGTMDPSGRGNTSAGQICGMIATILMIIGLIGVAMFFMFGFAAAVASHAH